MTSLRVALVAGVVMVAMWHGPAALACTDYGGVLVESAVDPADPDIGSRAIGIVEYETIAAAPYLGVTGPRSMSALSRSWGDPPSSSLRRDRGVCGDVRHSTGHRSLFVVLDDGTPIRLVGGLAGGVSVSNLAAIEGRFGPAVSHGIGIGLQAAVLGRLWILPLLLPAAVLGIAAVADHRQRRRRTMTRMPAVVSVISGLVLGTVLSFPDAGWSSVRLVAGFWALSFLAMLVGRFGPVSAIALVSGAAFYGIGAAPFTGRAGATEVAAFGIALLVVGTSIQATAPTRLALRAGHVAVVAGAAMIAGSIWVRGSLGGENGPIFFAGVFAALAAAMWALHVERSHFRAAAQRSVTSQ